MNVEAAIYSLLTWDATVLGLVSTRIYPVALDQDVALPAIVYQEISDVPDYSCDGATGQETSRYQITAWAETIPAAKTLGEAIKDVFSGYAGREAATTIQAAFVISKYDIPYLSDDSDEQTRYGKAIDVAIHTAT